MNRFEENWKYNLVWKCLEQPKRRLHSFFWVTLLRKGNAYLIQRDVDKYRNQLMLNDISGVIKLLGWTDQYEEDYYYIVQERRVGQSQDIFLHSCVGWYTPLKKRLSMFEYLQLEHLWEINTFIDIEQAIKEKGLILK